MIDLKLQKREFLYCIIIGLASFAILDGSNKAVTFSYNTNSKTQLMPRVDASNTLQFSIEQTHIESQSTNKTINDFAQLQIINDIIVMLKASRLSEKLIRTN